MDWNDASREYGAEGAKKMWDERMAEEARRNRAKQSNGSNYSNGSGNPNQKGSTGNGRGQSARGSIPEDKLERIVREIQIRLIPWDEIKLGLTPQYLIRDLYPLTGLMVVYGPPKEGKTFFVFDSVMHVALGRDYRGRRVIQGPVVYCLFEGQRNFAARKEAFRLKHLADYGKEIPFYLVSVKLQLVRDHCQLARVHSARHGRTLQ
jgi:hypothetical protein